MPSKIVTFAISASLVLNVVLLVSLARPSADGAVALATSGFETRPASGLPAFATNASYTAYYETLRAQGLSREDTKFLLLARLEIEARQAASMGEPAYWQSRDTSRLEFPQRLAAELDRARTVLADIYGSDAENDATFHSVFRPLGPQFSFLTPAQHVQVQAIKREQQMAANSAAATLSLAPGMLSEAVQPPASSPPESTGITSKLAAVLGDEALFEYRLRDSLLAERLRASRVEFSEPEFREAFRIVDRLDESSGDADVYASSRSALRTLLGGRRFATLWAGRDPTFAVIREACEDNALSDETALTVYEMFNDSQDHLIEVAEFAKSDPQRAAVAAREERTELQRRVSGLVGDDVAADILDAQTQHMLTMIRSQRLVPR